MSPDGSSQVAAAECVVITYHQYNTICQRFPKAYLTLRILRVESFIFLQYINLIENPLGLPLFMFPQTVVRFQKGWKTRDQCNYAMRNGQPMHQTEVIFSQGPVYYFALSFLSLPLYTSKLIDHTATVLLCNYRALPSIAFIYRITMNLRLDSSFQCTDEVEVSL